MTGARTVDEQLERVLGRVTPLEPVEYDLSAASGRTLAEPMRAATDIPVFDNSAMDGFAVRHADVAAASPATPVHLRVVADLPAGTDLDPPLNQGEAARIMTGAPVPRAADAVVPFEDTAGGLADSLGEITVLVAPQRVGAHIRARGGDAHIGDEVLAAGERLGALQLAAAAAAGLDRLVVTRAPRVAVVSTGSELVTPGAALRRGQIPESNGELISGLTAAADAEVVLRLTIPDEGSGVSDAIGASRARGADVIVFTGGVSAGAYEPVKGSLGHLMEFTRVAMQPGKPQGFGATDDGILLFGLPGNPVSAAVTFEVFVRPALLALQGRRVLARPVLQLAAGVGWRSPSGRRQYLPVVIDRADPGRWSVRPATDGGSASHLAGALARAEAFAIVPAEVEVVAAGDPVAVMLVS